MTSILKADTIQDTDGNNIINESSDTITIGASGDTVNIVGTLQNNGSAVGGVNTPAFMAYLSSNQNVDDNTITKVQCNTEHFDTAGAYDNSSNYRFTVPSGQAGKYVVYASLQTRSPVNDTQFNTTAYIYKNGSNYVANENNPYNNPSSAVNTKINIVLSLVVGDYLEFFGRTDVSDTSQNRFVSEAAHTSSPTIGTTHWGVYKIIE
jgi:hypothetical protein|tara:strand:+ start:538 stop:1158 length:621 start_codon:yes stop_codon:yes gene_type:complete